MLIFPVDEELVLRLPQENYLDEAFALVKQNHDHLRKWIPWVTPEFSIENARNFVRTNLQNFADNRGFAMHVVYRGRIAGNVGYNAIDWANKKCEIGYWLSEDAQGKGLMIRACRALIDYAFDQLKLNRVEIQCAAGNERSRRIPEKLGWDPLESTCRHASLSIL